MRLAQAIFTSVQGSRLNGYQLAATSSGVSPELIQELTTWGPAHDSLWDMRRDARSINFHPLAGDQFCLSVTTLGGEEYSARGGGRVYTQSFILPREVLSRFAGDPFFILRALAAAGRLVVYDVVPASLPSVPLLGRGGPPPAELVGQVLEDVGEKVFHDLTDAVANASKIAVLTSGSVERLFQAVLHAFPANERPSISFTTGLKDSPRRPFKLLVLPNDPTTVRQSQRMNTARIVDLAGEPLPVGRN